MQTAPRNQVSLGLKEESYGKSLRVRILLTPEDNDLRDTDKSRYFGWSYFNHFLAARGSDLPFFPPRERGSNYASPEY